MGYFATRSAALGVVRPSVVSACFYGFSDSMVRRALPDAWDYTTPDEALAARYDVFDAACRRLLGSWLGAPGIAAVASSLQSVVHGLSPHGRPMFAAHAHAHCPHEPHLALFWAATALREYRGDAHIVALQSAGVGPVAANVLMSAMRLTPHDQREYRGWSKEEWSDAQQALTARGWLNCAGSVSREGHKNQAEIERVTDQLAAPAWEDVEEKAVADAVDVLGPLVGTVVTAGELPYPNGMGVPPVPELAAPR
jgi:hypothetical protein